MIKNSLSGTRSVKSLKVEKPWEPTPSTFHFLSTNFFQWKQSEMPENIHKGVGQIRAFFDLMMPTYCQQNPTGKKATKKFTFLRPEYMGWVPWVTSLGLFPGSYHFLRPLNTPSVLVGIARLIT